MAYWLQENGKYLSQDVIQLCLDATGVKLCGCSALSKHYDCSASACMSRRCQFQGTLFSFADLTVKLSVRSILKATPLRLHPKWGRRENILVEGLKYTFLPAVFLFYLQRRKLNRVLVNHWMQYLFNFKQFYLLLKLFSLFASIFWRHDLIKDLLTIV